MTFRHRDLDGILIGLPATALEAASVQPGPLAHPERFWRSWGPEVIIEVRPDQLCLQTLSGTISTHFVEEDCVFFTQVFQLIKSNMVSIQHRPRLCTRDPTPEYQVSHASSEACLVGTWHSNIPPLATEVP